MAFKNKLKELISLGFINLSSSVIFGIFWLYLASIMTKEEYGELGFLIAIANVGATISLFGIGTMVVVYETKNENVFPSSFILVLISANITALVTFGLIQNVFVSILIVGMVIFQIMLSGLNSKRRYGDFSKHKIIRAAITVGVALVLFQIFGINGILLSYFLSTLFILKDLNSLIKNKRIEFSLLKPKIPFILHLFSTNLTTVFVRWGDKILIGSLLGFSALASYFIAIQYFFLLTTIPLSLSIYLMPQESQGRKNKKIKIFSIIISCLVSIISIIVIPYGINNFLPKYEESIFLMQILSVGIIPLTISSIQGAEFIGKENSRVVLIASVLQAGIYFGSILLLSQEFGIVGLPIGFVLAISIRVIFNFLIKKKELLI